MEVSTSHGNKPQSIGKMNIDEMLDVSNWARSSQVRSIEHSHTIVKIVQNVVFTSHAVMMTLNKIDEVASQLCSPHSASRFLPAFSQVGL